MRYWSWSATRAEKRAPPDIDMFVLYHDPELTSSVPHSLGLQKGLLGVVYAFADASMTASNNIVIAHEFLHTVGATDKYDPANDQPQFPDGYADPSAHRCASGPRGDHGRQAHAERDRMGNAREPAQRRDRAEDRSGNQLDPLAVNAVLHAPAHPALPLSVSGLCVDVARRRLVQDLEFSAAPGQFIAVLGENGVGKTLTLHTLAGLRPPAAGSVRLGDRDLEEWPRRELARALGLLAQSSEDPFPSTVLESALIGRHPHLQFWQWESEADATIARRALKEVDLAEREDRAIDTLSGGERRRLAIATILTQDPGVFLLDEATNHLDPHHQIDVLACFRARADAGRVVVASLHDATLAARFADKALLLYGDGSWNFGPVAQVLDTVHLSRLYHTPVHELEFRGRRVFVNE